MPFTTLVGKVNWNALIADCGLVKKSGGTPIYMALEGLNKRFPFKSDIYRAGMTMLLFVVEKGLPMKLLYLPIRTGLFQYHNKNKL